MEDLRELVNLVNKNKIKNIAIIDQTESPNRLFKFYELISQNKIETDEQASKRFFGKDPKDYRYRKLKNRLRQHLYNTLFFIDVNSPKFNEQQRAFYQCQKNLMTIRLLLARYGRTSAMKLVRKTITIAEKYELTDILVTLYETQRTHYATHETSRTKYERAKKNYLHYHDIAKAEKLAESLYEDLSLDIDEGKLNQSTLTQKAENYLAQLNELAISITSYRFNLIRFFLALQAARIKTDYEGTLLICDEALEFFASKPFVSNQFLGAFEYNKLTAYIQLGRYHEAENSGQKCLTLFEPDTIRWFNTQEFLYLLYMHTRRYQSAYRIFLQVRKNKFLKFQYQHKDEIWKIKEAFLYMLVQLGKLPLHRNTALTKFKINKFLNEVPAFSTMKRTSNIPILVVQFVILIVQRKYDKLITTIESLEKYTSRYLRMDSNFRSNCFIKMLIQIPKHHFHKQAVVRHSRRYLQKLQSVPLEIANQPFEIEIIPYEHLWEYILEFLDNKFH